MAGTVVPWWATPLVGGCFALVGVAVAQAIAVFMERRRRHREDHHRLDAPLREAALKYIAALQSYATYITTLSVGERLITGKPVRRDDAMWHYSEHMHAVDEAIAELTLAAPADLIAIADEFHGPSIAFNVEAQRGPVTERMKYQHADDVYNLISPFRNAVRVHLGLKAMPETPPANLAAYASD